MDPNATIERIRSIVVENDTRDENADVLDTLAMLDEVTDAFQSLDDWISHGGFLPAAWQQR